MKQRLLLISILLFLSMGLFAQNKRNTYTSNWEKVEKHDENSLPKSAIKEVEAILKMAIKEKNTPQIMKAHIYLLQFEQKIDRDTNYNMIGELEALLKTTNKVEDAALLHAVLTDMYCQHYHQDAWNINNRTNLLDVVPLDMKEWSANIYVDKILAHLAATVQNKEALQAANTKDYADIIDLGADSKIYYPTLYDFLMKRTIESALTLRQLGREEFDASSTGASIEQLSSLAKDYVKVKLTPSAKYVAFKYYQDYFADLQKRGMTNTIILQELSKFRLLQSLSNNFDKEQWMSTLIALEEEYSDNETTVEIIDAITSQLTTYDYYSFRRRPIESPREAYDTNQKVYNWLKKGIEKYADYPRIGILKNQLINLETPTLMLEGKKIFYANENVIYNVQHKNNQEAAERKSIELYRREDGKETLVKSYPLHFDSKTSYDADTAQLDLGKLPLGQYRLQESKTSHESTNYMFAVSDLISYARNSAKNEYEIFVVNRVNGKPVEGATVTLYEANYNQRKTDAMVLATLTTNHLGMVSYTDAEKAKNGYKYHIAAYTIALGKDNGLEDAILYSGSYNYERHNSQENEAEKNRLSTSIFADRSIYRPGQTMYLKTIVIDKQSKIVANKKQVIKLYNPQGEEIAEKTLVSNEFGSIATEFILPQTGLLGTYWVTVDGADNLHFRVEEYKRPTFEVKFDKVEATYSLGDKITLKGNAKTFSGISLQGADVNYSITRRPFTFWFWDRSNESHYADGLVRTNDDGTFEIEFAPEAGSGKSIFDNGLYTFNISASITDLNGETQSTEHSLSVGKQSMLLQVVMPSKIEKSQDAEISIKAINLNGADVETSGTYTIYTLDKNDSIQTKVLEGSFKTGIQKDLLAQLKKINSGKLRIEVLGKDDKNREVKSHFNFVLYSFADKKPPYETEIWVAEKETTFKGKKTVEVIYGTSEKDAYVLYQLYNNTTVFERKFIKLSNENKAFKVDYKEEYGEEIFMIFVFMKDGALRSENISLKKEEPKQDIELKVKFDVFRDKLRPGQEETWTMSISDSQDKAVSAEVLASMYDVSLDKIYPMTGWLLSRPYVYKDYITRLSFDINRQLRGSYTVSLAYNKPSFEVKPFDFDSFFYGENNRRSFYYHSYDRGLLRSVNKPSPVMAKLARESKEEHAEFNSVVSEEVAMTSTDAMPAPPVGGQGQESAPQIRSNFNETAFFFPQLKTNAEGKTVISFTVPESNTTWQFRAFAHDKDSRMGELEKLVVTRKELMVTPNMPRFVRQGDKTSISTKISNLSENLIDGNVRLEFFNPINDKAIDLGIKDVEQAFSLAADASTSATWLFDVPADIEMIGVRIVADSKTFSDGEQHVVAVLPNRMLVTETLPVDVVEKGEQTYVLDKLVNNKSNTLDNYKLTFEFASNPAWYAIQALPTLSNPTNENAVNWFASYYVNTLGASLMKQYPKVANMINVWKKQGGTKETLVSKLAKDEELKTLLLEETPWVMDAKSETEQMERLSLLFDFNNTKQLTSQAIRKLEELQTLDGGWSWYNGLHSNRSITQYLLYGFANLQRVGYVEYPEQVKMMQMNALKSVDEQIVSDFNELKKYKDWKKTSSLSTNQLEYLYIRAMYRDIPISQEAREAERFYTEVASKNWAKLGLYEKSLLAVLLPQLGEKTLAAKVTASIKEHSVSKKELGTYWPNNRARVFLAQSAVSTHTFMMDALKANGATTEEMDNMKRWLVKQKQTQIWETTHATIDAIGALLQEGSNWFESESVPTIKVGQMIVKPENAELGTGYFKTSWTKTEIKPTMGTVTIDSEDSKPAYGALYWQYYENLDKITKQDGALNINKELYKEVVDGNGKSLVKITESNPLTVGDKVIVRLVVRTDRDMEFVQLKDMRASCFEPMNTRSGVEWQNSVPYYQTTKDASTNYFFDVLPEGTYVFEYAVYVNRVGEYSNGITSIQSAYAPEFTSHTAGIKVVVK